MINCTFEGGKKISLRHVVLHAIVERKNKILLVKRSKESFLESGKWALPGGFLDRDESAKEGVLRELKEETGWEGRLISLFKINSSPNRPYEDRQNVALDFIIEPINKSSSPDHEISQVEWFYTDNLPSPDELAFDHGETIDLYLEYKKKEFSLPVFV